MLLLKLRFKLIYVQQRKLNYNKKNDEIRNLDLNE